MFKNLSLQKVSLIAAILVVGTVFFVYLLTTTLFKPYSQTLYLISFFLIGFISTYFTLRFIFDRFVYRKIKLIYKVIQQSKVSIDEKKVDFSENVLENVQQDVAKWAEDQRDQIEYLRALEDYRRDYVGNISHELKTPIFNIQGYLHTLLDGGLEDQSINRHYLNRAAKNVERLQNMVQDLDLINRLESGKHILDLRIFDIRQLTEEIFDHLEMAASVKKIRLILKDGADQPFRVKADRENIRQVLINLVNNAIKYGNEAGYVKVGFYDMENYLLVEVADNGIGIDNHHLPHLFDRFYRVEKSRSRAEGGTGLGLSIVKHIIEAHKQTINVRSTPQRGSTFGFTLQKA